MLQSVPAAKISNCTIIPMCKHSLLTELETAWELQLMHEHTQAHVWCLFQLACLCREIIILESHTSQAFTTWSIFRCLVYMKVKFYPCR